MGNLFTHHPKPGEITDADRAVLSLKAQRRKLEDQSKLLELRIEHNVTVARELVSAGKKERALLALKKKKLNERQLGLTAKYLLNVEDLLSNMEFATHQNRILAALKEGAAALKAAQSEWTVDDLEKLMDETAEAKEYQDKVFNVLSTQLDATDAEAAAEELERLEVEVHGTAAQQAAAMPSAPTAAHAAAATAATAEDSAEDGAEDGLPAAPTAAHAAGAAGEEEEGAEEMTEEARQLERPMVAA